MTLPNSDAINLRLDTVNLVQNAAGSFSAVGSVPGWLADFGVDLASTEAIQLQDCLLFFDTYLQEIQDGLQRDPAAVLASGPWSETDRNGVVRDLSALAFQEDDQLVLQIKLIANAQKYQQSVFQQARNYSLKFERLIREREHKEILLHTIIHDLAGPLTSIHGVLELMKRGQTSERLTTIALEQCELQKTMIASILDAFVSGSASQHLPSSESAAPDIVTCANQAVARFQPAFESKNVSLVLTSEIDQPVFKVLAEEDLLERVFSNLLENALRYSPPSSTTELRLATTGECASVSILDEGPGISDAIRASIFDRYSGGGDDGGQVGLGLYFCKIALERWGGSLRCENRQGRAGSQFTFEVLPFAGARA